MNRNRMVFQWKDTVKPPVSAQIAGEEIVRIREEHGSFFKPAFVVEAARPEGAPLHPAFEWNDGVAAEKWREEQARSIVRMLVLVNEQEPEQVPMRAFVSVKDDESEHVYTTMNHAMRDPSLRAQVLANAERDFKTFERKYRSILDLSGVVRAFARSRRAVARVEAPAHV